MEKNTPEYVQEYRQIAIELRAIGAVGEPIFSRGTYQFEVAEKGKKKAFPFIQMNDEGKLTDSFCSCKVSETGKGCPHLAAAYLQIFNGTEEPLHVRFRKSLWSRIFQMASKRHGYEPDCLKKEKEGFYSCESKTKKPLFSIEATNAKTRKKLEAIVSERPIETEETSIKFSNLPAEEMGAYRAGNASHTLRFELSFWSDLAKWLMVLDEAKEPYEILFNGSPLPQEMKLHFPGLGIWFYISEVNWPWIIPALSTVEAPLKVFEPQDSSIEKVEYDEIEKQLRIHHKGWMRKESDFVGIPIGEWLYVEGKGFYRKRDDSILAEDRIPSERIGYVLNHSEKSLEPFLKIHSDKKSCKYQLHFDSDGNLHIELYVQEIGDMQSERSACFVPWAYVPDQGFFLLDEWLFEGKEKIVPRKEVAEFINRHRLWLHNFPGFQTHLGSLESHLTYRLNEEGLSFDAELNFPENYEETYHFDEWVYIKGQGFYMKKEARGRLPLHPGLKIPAAEISSFIFAHKEELEQVQGFYNPILPIQKNGLYITIEKDGLIAISPKMEYTPGVDPGSLIRFGDYIFQEGKGFSEIPPASRLPERYQHPLIIQGPQEAAFLAYELEPLKPYILDIDPRLIVPHDLKLKIRKIAPSKKRKGQEWLIDLVYVSEKGAVDIFSLWDAFQEKKRHLFSLAGLIYLKEPRFNWIRQLPAKRLDRKKGLIRLNTLEWIRLTVFEPIEEPEEEETKNFLDELNRLETSRILDISRLKATLRPYQEQGLNWLWFLYCHGLSGLLCDDMGLGKTHQAMALLAAVINEEEEKKSNKYLVICPTSVIYHWQELLKRFLPEIRVCTYYGLERTLEDFEENYDLLLTSYGIMRTGRENLRAYRFEVAIFDEIQIAKNYASQTHKALRSIRAQMRLGLSGTPIENRLRELKSLIDIALPGYMPADPIFREIFITPIEKNQDPEKKALLAKLVKPFILRRKKSEVLTDLPEKIEEIAYCDLSEEQKGLYKEVALKMRDTVYQDLKDPRKPIAFMHVFSALTALKQICDHPSLVIEQPKPYHAHQSGKWDLFVELLNEARESGQKVVVFSQYLEMLAIIESYLKKKGIGFATIKGSTRDRPEQLRRFREDPGCEVFLASLLAAGVGIDLTVASIVIHFDRWWNPAKENQATDRVHRIGQNRGVQVFKLVTKHTIEEHIHEMIERKKGLIEDIVGGEDQISYLSREELLQVFETMYKEINEE